MLDHSIRRKEHPHKNINSVNNTNTPAQWEDEENLGSIDGDVRDPVEGTQVRERLGVVIAIVVPWGQSHYDYYYQQHGDRIDWRHREWSTVNSAYGSLSLWLKDPQLHYDLRNRFGDSDETTGQVNLFSFKNKASLGTFRLCRPSSTIISQKALKIRCTMKIIVSFPIVIYLCRWAKALLWCGRVISFFFLSFFLSFSSFNNYGEWSNKSYSSLI